MGLKTRQFGLLLWKNLILQIRRPIGTVFEVLLPFLATSLLLLARILTKSEDVCFTTFEPGFSSAEIRTGSDLEQLESCVINGTGCPYLAYYPKNNMTDSMMALVAWQLKVPLSTVDFSSQAELSKKAAEDIDSFYAVIEFDIPTDATTLPRNTAYKVRLAHDILVRETWRTDRTYPGFDLPGPRIDNFYKTRFLELQHAVDTAITGFQLSQLEGPMAALLKLATVEVQLQQYPYPAFVSDPFLNVISFLMPFLICLSFIYSAGTVVKEIVIEKENRLKESMKMMGLANWLHWLAWFLKNLAFLSIPILLITILLKVGRVFPNSNPIVLFVFFLLWVIASILWGFAISVFFSRARLGLIFGIVLWYLNYLPVQFISYDDSSNEVKTAASLLQNVAFGFGVQVIVLFEGQGVGLQWSNIATSPSHDDPFNMLIVFLMLILDAFIFLFITWYVEAVFPGSYGIPKPIYFPFLRSYWCGVSVGKRLVADDSDEMGKAMSDKANHEPNPVGLPVGIKISNISKIYKSSVGSKLAVDNLSLNMHQGQITALLGHNGAGKTTIMSILTGLFPPTSGTAEVNGHSIVSDMDSVRRSLGLCPQHNVLFDRLTVKEHLELFLTLKGKRGPVADQEVSTMIVDLQLADKTNERVAKLSGGMKRKLSCAIALIGGSEVVFLDEPTSGMDPYARRATWDLLLKYRQGRTMVLTTHFMDEADLLGDRIAIMANGELLCSGSSLFLKNRFGVGYHLTLVRTPTCSIDAVQALVTAHVPGAHLEGNVGSELDYILPRDSTAAFKQLFTELEESRKSLGIGSLGISVTTMEEVFIKAGEMAEKVETDNSELPPLEFDGSRNYLEQTQESLTGVRLKLLQFSAIFIKRFLYSKRDRKSIVTQFFLPLFFIIFGLAVLAPSGSVDDPPRLLTLENISNHNPAIEVQSYAADLRSTGSGSMDVLKYLGDILSPLAIPSVNVTSDVEALITGNAVNLTNGVPRSDNTDCCDYTNMVLNARCVDALVSGEEASDLCSDVKTFGYYGCKDCINKTVPTSVCPVGANTSLLSDPNTYFQEYVLRQSENAETFFEKYICGFTLTDGGIGKTLLTGWYSNEAYHTSSETLNVAGNILLKYLTNDSYSIATINSPLPNSVSKTGSSTGVDTFTLSLMILYGMSFLAASFINFIVGEKQAKAKHIQIISGLDHVTYWVANLCWDLVNYLVIFVCLLIVFAAFNIDAFSGENMGALAIMLLLFGFAVIPLVYLLSFLFSNPITAYSVTVTVFSLLGMCMVITVFVLEVIGTYADEANLVDHIFMIMPVHCLSRGLQQLSSNVAIRSACTATETDMEICSLANISYSETNFDWDKPGIGQHCLYLALEGIIFFALTILIEFRFFIPPHSPKILAAHNAAEEDPDVLLERSKVDNLDPRSSEYAVVLKNLSKKYRGKKTPAVDQLTLAVPKGECFGLLGVNGAGKTTTFGMLTGDLNITAGRVYMQGYSILKNRRKAQQLMGYCPQFDALLDRLTGRELLMLFARLRGIRQANIKGVVSSTITQLNLDKWADKLCGTYSGGNKRKLNTAAALVGDPPIVLLDEPTSGMDPKARRHLWNTLVDVMKDGRSIVLTSHSMEECEALCTRLAIMVNGQFKCLGSTQHLKSRFGKGYTMTVRVEPNKDVQAVKNFVQLAFLGSCLLEEHLDLLHYKVNNEQLSWSYIFGTLEENRASLGIVDYSVSQTTLEQVFINFAKEQHSEDTITTVITQQQQSPPPAPLNSLRVGAVVAKMPSVGV